MLALINIIKEKLKKKDELYLKAEKAAYYLTKKSSQRPKIGIILGTGLGNFADCLDNKVIIPYKDIPYFVGTTVSNHKGNMVFGNYDGIEVVAFQGRHHIYEGKSLETITFPIRVLKLLDIKYLIISNASGGVNEMLQQDDIVIIKDHINFQSQNPLIGKNSDSFGERFPDMSQVYSLKLRNLCKKCMIKQKLDPKEGVYMALTGPSFETPAEIKMVSFLGADLVGMSTIPEAIIANHMKMEVLGLSLVCNMAAGISKEELSDNDVVQAAKVNENKFKSLIQLLIYEMNKLY